MGDIPYITTLCLNGTLQCVDFMDVTMGDVSGSVLKVFLSTRRGAWIVSRMGPLGFPADALANSRFMFTLPQSWLQWMVELIANYRFDHDNYGLKARHG